MMEPVWRSLDVEGLETWYQVAGKEGGAPLIFIHGLGIDSTFWRRQLAAFAPEYRVAALDLPGHGRSAKPHDRVYSMDFFARAVHALVEREHLERPVLIGHSMGFPVLRRYLLLYPGWARAICNVDGFYFRRAVQAEAYEVWSAATSLLRWRFSGRDPVEAGERFIEYTFYEHTPEAVREEVRATSRRADPYVVMSAWRDMIRPLKWVKCCFMLPAMVLYCRALHTLPDQELYFRTCFPRMRYMEWTDTGHYPMLEQPDRFNAELRAFLYDEGIR